MFIDVTLPWKMLFDGASHKDGAGAGVVFVTSEGHVLPYSFTLMEVCSNNVAEYQALLLGLRMAVDIKQRHLQIYGDSKMVINQLLGEYEVRKPELMPYAKQAKRLIAWIGDVTLEHVPRRENKQADALAKLASTITIPGKEAHILVYKDWVSLEEEMKEEDSANVVQVFEVDGEEEDWCQPLVDYLKYEKLPQEPKGRTNI